MNWNKRTSSGSKKLIIPTIPSRYGLQFTEFLALLVRSE